VWHEATARFIDDLAREQGLVITSTIAPLPDGHDARLEIALFRVIQEALTNVVRHAQARHAWVCLDVTGEGIELTIEDDGIGIGSGAMASAGFGLRGMRERIELLGGRLNVADRPGRGTRIQVLLPATGCAGASDSHVPGDGLPVPAMPGRERS
jgi:two-component system sensor histidine kinase UhpB